MRKQCPRLIAFVVLLNVCHSVVQADSVRNLYAVAAGHYAAARWEIAAEEFKKFIDRYPKEKLVADARFFLGEALVQTKEYNVAASVFREFVAAHPSHPSAARGLFRWGECALNAGDVKSAARSLKEFRKKHPTDRLNEYALAYLGRMAAQAGQADDAARLLSESLRKYPNGAKVDEVRLRLGILSFQSKDYPQAEQHFDWIQTHRPEGEFRLHSLYWSGITKLARGAYSAAAASLVAAYEIDPDGDLAAPSAYYAGESYRFDKKGIQAIEQFEICRSKGPVEKFADLCLLRLIELSLESRHHDRVGQYVQEFAERFPQSPMIAFVYNLQGRSYLMRKDNSQAFQFFQKALKNDKSNQLQNTLRYHGALALLGDGANHQAVQILEEIDPPFSSPEFEGRVQFALASAHFQQNNFERSAELFAHAIGRLEPGPLADNCRTKRIQSLLQLKQFERAGSELPSLLENSNHFDATIRQLADALYAAQEYDQAINHFRTMTSRSSIACYGWSGLGWCYFQKANYEESARSFRQSLAVDSAHALSPEAAFMLAKSLEKSVHDFTGATYETVYQTYPNSKQASQAMFAHAKLLAGTEKDRSVRLFEKIAARFPDYEQMDAVLYEWAWTLHELGRNDPAMEIFKKLLTEHPTSVLIPDAKYRLAKLQFDAKSFDHALDHLKQILAEHRSHEIWSHAVFLLARVHAQEGRWKLVADVLDRFAGELEQQPMASDAHFWRGEAYYRIGKLDDAKNAFEQISLKSTHVERRALIKLRMAQILLAQQDWTKALDQAQQMATEYPTFQKMHEVSYVLARSYAGLGEFTKAREQFTAVVENESASGLEIAAMAQWMIGETYYHQRDFELAIRAYLRVEILYDYPEWKAAALLQAAKCYDILQEEPEAARLYKRIVEAYPNTEYASEAAKKYHSLVPEKINIETWKTNAQ